MTPLPRYALPPPIDSLHTMGVNNKATTNNSNMHNNHHNHHLQHHHHGSNRKNGHYNTYPHHHLPPNNNISIDNCQINTTSEENINDIAVLSETFLGNSVAQINKREVEK